MIRSGHERGDTFHSLIMFFFLICVLTIWVCSLIWKLWDYDWCTFLEKWVWFEYFSCMYIFKVGHGDPQNLLRSVCSHCPPTLPAVSVLGENKSKNPWSLRKGHSITPFSLPQLGRCLESGMKSVGLYLFFQWRKKIEKSLWVISWHLPKRRVARVTSALENVLQEDLFYCHGKENGVREDSRKRVAALPKTRTHCTIARPGKGQEEEVCEENSSVANLELFTYEKRSNILG